MPRNQLSRRDLVAALGSLSALVATPGCGLVLYSERRGQPHSKQLDALVVVLDGVLCLVGVIPGIVAFAVDFSTGCIYWPDGRPNGQLNGRQLTRRTRRVYERALSEALNMPIRLDDPSLRFQSSEHVDADQLLDLVAQGTDASHRLALLEDEAGDLVGFELA